MLLFIAWSFSLTSIVSHLGTFLVRLTIVLSLRKGPIELVLKPAHVSFSP